MTSTDRNRDDSQRPTRRHCLVTLAKARTVVAHRHANLDSAVAMLRRILAGAVLAVMFTGGAAAGVVADIKAAKQRGDYATELRLVRPLAEQGASWAQLVMGNMYRNGEGIPQDFAGAAKWYRLD